MEDPKLKEVLIPDFFHLESIKNEMKGNVVVDLRNVYDAKKMAENGFDYSSVGRAAEDLPEF